MSPTAAPTLSAPGRPTQAERRARSRSALLESAARGLSRYGYGNLMLEEVAREAGYTRGALYHQFKDKEDLALAVIEWVNDSWMREVSEPAEQQPDPVAELLALARGLMSEPTLLLLDEPSLDAAGTGHPFDRHRPGAGRPEQQ